MSSDRTGGAADPREEAERLVATVLGSASVAAENLTGFATGSAECCVCPVCKAIAAARDPDARMAERIATGAGDIAAGIATFLRTMSRGAAGGFGAAGPGRGTGGASDSADPWHTATRAAESAPEAAESAAGAAADAPGAAEPAAPPVPPKPMARKATKPKAAPTPPAEPVDGPGEE